MLFNVTALPHPIKLPVCYVCYCLFLACVHLPVANTHNSVLLQLTVPLIKAEMEKTLQWLVPIATNTTK